MYLAPSVIHVEHPWAVHRDMVAELGDGQLALRASGRSLRIWRLARAVGRDLREHRGPGLEVILRIHEVLVAVVGLEPHVVVAVVLGRDVDHDSHGMLARVPHLQAGGLGDATLGGAPRARGGWGGGGGSGGPA